MKQLYALFWFIVATATAMVGHTIHSSVGWSIVNFLFWPLSWAKWLVCQEVNLSIIKQTFGFFFA